MSSVAEQLPVPTGVLTPVELLANAVQRGADLEYVRTLMDLKDRWEATEARKAFVVAMSAFKAEPIKILKSKRVDISGGAKFSHATLADVVDGVCVALSAHGLSHKWETKQEAGMISVTCIITHESGHSERVTLSAPPDDSGKKNSIQQVASTVTYLERYTLMAACGLAAKDMDDDGRGANKKPTAEAAPEGYENWQADMKAVADEGTTRLQEVWGKADQRFRRYVIKFDEPWWGDLKARAARVQP